MILNIKSLILALFSKYAVAPVQNVISKAAGNTAFGLNMKLRSIYNSCSVVRWRVWVVIPTAIGNFSSR